MPFNVLIMHSLICCRNTFSSVMAIFLESFSRRPATVVSFWMFSFPYFYQESCYMWQFIECFSWLINIDISGEMLKLACVKIIWIRFWIKLSSIIYKTYKFCDLLTSTDSAGLIRVGTYLVKYFVYRCCSLPKIIILVF